MRAAALLLALLATSGVTAAESYLSALPTGRVKVDVMKAVTTPRAAQLAAKLERAPELGGGSWQTDEERLDAAANRVAQARPTAPNHDRVELERLRTELELVKIGQATIEFVRMPDGRIRLEPDASLPELNGVVIDVNHDAIDTPYGRTSARADITSSEDPRAESAWSGTQWSLAEEGEDLDATSVKFVIGQLRDDRRTILSFDAKQIQSGKMPRRASCIIVLSN
ncbi:MAG TPA: hypothetical protein VHW00_17740 [Thermoanaerobaculia bacterium]|nr:hypothetical protein [Thermoanaerobaculia bacterium]